MRKVTTPDVFEALRLIEKSGLKDKLVPIVEDIAKHPDTLEHWGIVGFLTVLETFAAESCENLIYEWLSGPCECNVEEIKSWDLDVFSSKITQLSEENNFSGFFSVLSKLAGRKR